MIGSRIRGIQCKAAFEFRFSLWPLPIVKPQRACQRRVCLAELRVQPQGPHRGRFAFGKRILRRQTAIPSQKHVRISQTSMSESVDGVFLYGLLKAFDGLVKSFLCPPVPVMTTFQVEPVGL